MKRTLISLCIAAAYGGPPKPPVLFGLLPHRVVHWKHASDSPFDWGSYFTGNKP